MRIARINGLYRTERLIAKPIQFISTLVVLHNLFTSNRIDV